MKIMVRSPRSERKETATKQAMRSTIALVTDDFLPAKTGVGVHVQQIAPALVSRGHSVLILTTRRPGQPEFEEWNGARVYRFFSLPIAGFYQALPSKSVIVKILQDNQVDRVHFHYLSFMMFNVLRAARSLCLPTVFTAHMSVDVLTQHVFMKPFHQLLAWGCQWLLNRVDHILCVSRQQMEEFKPFKAQKTFISNPIDFDGNEAEGVERSNTFSVLVVGRLDPKKNVGYLIESFRRLAEKHADVELRIAGAGTEQERLRAQVNAAGLRDKVAFLGHVPHDQLPVLYRACHVFVLPSLLETQGMVVMEAMRFCRPVIVTDKIISARELVQPGVNGFIVDAGSAADLADKLAYLYDNPLKSDQMGQAGHDQFPIETPTSVAEKLSALYLRKSNKDPRHRWDFGGSVNAVWAHPSVSNAAVSQANEMRSPRETVILTDVRPTAEKKADWR